MATDAQGNLYVPDVMNNRVLRYNNPFSTDTVADYVWGQADMQGRLPNRGYGEAGPAGANSLALFLGNDWMFDGVAIDKWGNLWVSDVGNNRVLRFPFAATMSPIGFLSSCVSRFFFPAQNAALPLIVNNRDDLLTANGLMPIIQTVGLLAGPALAGFAIGLWGPQVAFIFNSAAFCLSVIAITTIGLITGGAGLIGRFVLREPG